VCLIRALVCSVLSSLDKRDKDIVIVARPISRLFIGFFVNPVLYEIVAREGDVLQI
jgi:heavy metal efflux system protein